MVDFLFGWILKPTYQLTFIDNVMAIAEIFLVMFLICVGMAVYYDIKEKIKRRKKDENN